MFGIGGPERADEGLQLAWGAFLMGDPTGTNYVGLAAEAGLLQPVNLDMASRLYAGAIAAGDVPSAIRLAHLVFNGQASGKPDELIGHLERAASLGFADAAALLGDAYKIGQITTRDPAAAASWYQRSAELGSAYAAAELAALHLRGETTGLADEEALAFARQTVQDGSDYGLHVLGQFLAEGYGTPADPEAAVRTGRRLWAAAWQFRRSVWPKRLSRARVSLLIRIVPVPFSNNTGRHIRPRPMRYCRVLAMRKPVHASEPR